MVSVFFLVNIPSSMSVTLYRKYRPQHFSEVSGQESIVRTFENALKLGRVGQAYLLTGPRGTGKTTLARLFAKAVNCSQRQGAEPCDTCKHCRQTEEGRSLDIIEIDAASHTGVDNIRELRDTVKLLPTTGSHKIYIIDEVHMLSTGAFNALLKTLEEPPSHVIFILATTEIHKVPATILSRCQRFDLSRLPLKNITTKLATIAQAEKIQITPGALQMIAEIAEGGMRDAESLLTQIVSLTETAIDETTVSVMFGSSEAKNLIALAEHLAHKDVSAALRLIGTLSQDGKDLSVFAGSFLNFLRKLLLASAAPKEASSLLQDIPEDSRRAILEIGAQFTPREIVRMLEFFQVAKRDSKHATIPELPLEIALVKSLSPDEPVYAPPAAAPPASPTVPKPAPSFVAPSPVTGAPAHAPARAPIAAPKPKETSIAHTPSTLSQPREDVTAPAFSLAEIQTAWKSIVAQTKVLNASLALALMQSSPQEVREHTVVLQTKHNFHKERLESPESKLTLGQAFAKILSFEPKFQIVLEKASVPQGGAALPAASLASQAAEMLGGTIVSEQR